MSLNEIIYPGPGHLVSYPLKPWTNIIAWSFTVNNDSGFTPIEPSVSYFYQTTAANFVGGNFSPSSYPKFYYTINGNLISFNMTAFTGTIAASQGNIQIVGLPAAMFPATTQAIIFCPVTFQAGPQDIPGLMDFATNGVLSIYPTASSYVTGNVFPTGNAGTSSNVSGSYSLQ